MHQRFGIQLFNGLLPRASVISVLIFLCCLGIGMASARELMKIHTKFSREVVYRHPQSSWGRELRLAQLVFPDRGEGLREPWGLEEIRWYVSTFFKGLGNVERWEVVRVIHDECLLYGLAPQLVLSLIAAESEGTPYVVSPKGAIGLMQLHPTTAQSVAAEVKIPWRGEDSLYHPVINVRLGIRYLFNMIQRYQNLPLALSAYYMGPTKLDRVLMRDEELPWHYVDRVLDLYRTL